MRALVTGSMGQLGRALRHRLEEGRAPEAWQDAQVDWVDLAELDIADAERVDGWFGTHEAYDVVFNCAAMTNVDGCEADFATAFAANALGPLHLARACRRSGATLVHISTDYVFPGTDPAERVESDVPAPVSAYGRSKLAGEGLARAENPRTHSGGLLPGARLSLRVPSAQCPVLLICPICCLVRLIYIRFIGQPLMQLRLNHHRHLQLGGQ